MNARQAVTTSASKEHESPDGERFILRQPFAMAGTTVPTICQPAISPTERVALTGEDIDNFVSFARAQYNKEIQETDFDLRSWVALETLKIEGKAGAGPSRKLTVAFAIGKLLRHLKSSVSSYSQCEILHLCSIDNFLVQMVANGARDEGWEVSGIEMVSPSMAIQVMPTSFSGAIESVGNCIDAVVTRHSPFCCAKKSNQDERDCDSALCYAFGVLVRFIFSDGSSLDSSSNSQENPQETQKQNYMNDFLRSLSISPSRVVMNTNDLSEPSRPTKLICDPSHYDQKSISVLGMPSLVAALVRDLLACQQENDIFESRTLITLDAAIDDLHMLLTRPGRFLFGANQELPTVTNMYGRASESSALLDAFRRVTARGQSEAFFVKGFSGSGKTRLVQCAVDAAVAARGLVVQKKFEVNSTNQLYLVLSAFNDLCEQLAKDYYGSAKGGTVNLWHQLVIEFGSSLHMLANILPNIISLTPSPAAAFSLVHGHGTKGDVNFFSLCDIIKRFMRVLSSTAIPVLMVLDDLQWSDPVSLGLVHAVLSDKKGASCMFFLGSYRDNEVNQQHILHGFHSWLSTSDVPSSTIHLDGISQENVLSLISDSLGMLPRLCLSLSQVIYRKTEGNPLFVQTFLRSLVDKRMLTYSPRERVWVWEIDQIHDEGIAPNVLDLLGAKMAACSAGLRIALQVASCFGIQVDKEIVKILSGTWQYLSLLADLNKAVDYGMMDFDGSNYKFVHDKVREAAYDTIDLDARDKFHFDIGMLLYPSFAKQSAGVEGKTGILFFTMLDQIHRGVPDLLQDEDQRVVIAKMNHEAASQMMQSYNYTAAYQYAERAVALLPKNCWSRSDDDITIDVYFLLSKAAYSNGKIDRAMSALSEVIEHANSINMSLQLRLDAYKLKHDIILDSCVPGEMTALLNTILDVLASLGEDLRSTEHLCKSTISDAFRLASEMFEIEFNDASSHAYRVDSCDHTPVMEAYHILSNLAFLVKPKLCPYFVARWAMYTLRNKVMCKYTPAAYVSFGVVMCKDMSFDDMEVGHRIGKLGLRIMHERSYDNMLPVVYLSYYGYIGCLFEPLQAVIDMHQRAIDVSLNLGNSTTAAFHEGFLIVRKKYAGENLLEMKQILERWMNMQDHPGSSAVLQLKLHENYEGVCALIGETTSGLSQTVDGSCPHSMSRLMTCCYLGQYERAVHMAEKWDPLRNVMLTTSVPFRRIYQIFYYGLSCIGLRRQKSKKGKHSDVSRDKLWQGLMLALDVVKDAARCSKYNFENKRALLMAEKLSYSCNYDGAEEIYGTAIKASKSSHFIHEEALSCELAGAHYERLGKFTQSLELYKQAESCYDIWGSMVKSRQMRNKINNLEPKLLK